MRLLGDAAYAQSIKPLKRPKNLSKVAILGFDTEYDSQTQELISVQLAFPYGPTLFKPTERVTWEDLWTWATGLLRQGNVKTGPTHLSTVILVTHFSIAEMQHLDWWADLAYIREHSTTYEWTYPGTVRTVYRCPACWRNKVEVDETARVAICYHCDYADDVTRFLYKRPQQTMRVVDLQTWFPGQSLAQVAETFGERKLDWERDQVTKADLNKPGFREYAVHDAVLTARIYTRLRDAFKREWGVDIAETRTPASTSGAIFRQHYVTEEINNPNHRARKLAMLANWGGNNQAFRRGSGEGLYFEYDAKSMYPSATMALGRLPRARDIVYLSQEEVFDPRVIGGWCHVTFEFPETEEYPCLPVYDGNALLYPLSGETYCTIEEVRFARELGAKLTIHEAYGYATGTPALAAYLSEMFQKRKEAQSKGDTVRSTMFKLMMNSIIGKLCQKVVKWDVNDLKAMEKFFAIPVRDLLRMDEGTFQEHAREFEEITGKPCRQRVNVGSLWMPEWNTLILGYARATLARAFHHTRAILGTTDSLITDRDLGETFELNGILFERRTWARNLSVVRTRLYSMWGGYCLDCKIAVDELCKCGKEEGDHYCCPQCGKEAGHPKTAFHGIHNYDAAVDILRNQFPKGADEADYTVPVRFVKLREALRTGQNIGATRHNIPRTVSLGWDNKRELIKPGWMVEKEALFERFRGEVESDLPWCRRMGYDGSDEALLFEEIRFRIRKGVFGVGPMERLERIEEQEKAHRWFYSKPLRSGGDRFGDSSTNQRDRRTEARETIHAGI